METVHTATVHCGECGHDTVVALGGVAAIVCGGCRVEICFHEEDEDLGIAQDALAELSL